MIGLIALMSIGVIMGRKPISGSCGGMKALGMEMECEICGGNPSLCDEDGGDTRAPRQSDGNKADIARLAKKVD